MEQFLRIFRDNFNSFFNLQGLIILWLLILSVLFLRLFILLNKLTRGSDKKNLIETLDKISKQQNVFESQIDQIQKKCQNIEENARHYFQKIGFVRFNPFSEVGGDQSFIVTLLDADKNGIVLSSLHSRSGTRIYAKPVQNGKGTKYELFKEEIQAINDSFK